MIWICRDMFFLTWLMDWCLCVMSSGGLIWFSLMTCLCSTAPQNGLFCYALKLAILLSIRVWDSLPIIHLCSVSHTFIYLWQSATISTLATIYGISIFLFSLTQDSTRQLIACVTSSDTVDTSVVFNPPVKQTKKRIGGLFNAVGWTVPSSAKKTTGLIVEIKPLQRAPGLEECFFVMSKQCNYILMWCTGDFFLKANAVINAFIGLKTRLYNDNKSLTTPGNYLIYCWNLRNLF